MADININVRVNPDQSSFRRLQQSLARTVADTRAEIDVQATPRTNRSLRQVRDSLNTIGQGTRGAERNIGRFSNRLSASQRIIQSYRNSLQEGNRAAFDFGVGVSRAARRLLEWATPAAFIFSTISRLREAVGTITDLDTQARRLEFFQAGSNLDQASRSAVNFSTTIANSQRNLQGFLDVARRTGVATRDVVEAFVTASRVGVTVSDTLDRASRSAADLGRNFETTVLSLVRLEAGALSAEQAVRRLRAIQAQFLDVLRLTPQASDRAIANIGDSLAIAAANSTFNVDQLGNAVARLGTSLQNLQGSNPQAVIDIIAQTARVTGAEVGRLSTTFRQLTALTVQNAEQIRRISGGRVQIVDPNTGQQSFQGLLDFLQELNRLQQTDVLQASEFARLGTDRRNVNELRQFASAISQLEGGFQRLASRQQQVARAGQNAAQVFIADRAQALSLRSAFNRLSAEIDNLGKTILGSEGLTSLVNLFTSAVRGATSFVSAVERIQPVLAALGTFIIVTLVPRIGAAFLGLGVALRTALTGGVAAGAAGLFANTRLLATVAAGGVLIGGLIANSVGEGFRQRGRRDIAAGIQSGVTGAIAGGLIGAQIGSAIAPGIGTAVGGAIGLAVGGAGGALLGVRSENARIERDRKIAEEAQQKRLQAIAAQRQIILARSQADARLAASRTRAENRIVQLQREIQSIQLNIQAAEGNRNRQAELLREQTARQVELERAKANLQREQLATQARQLAAAAELARIRRQEQEQLARINVLQEARIQGLPEEQVIPIRLEFNQRTINERIRAIRRQIQVELSRQQDIDVQVNAQLLERSRQRVLALESRERILRFQAVQQEIQLRRQLLNRQNTLVNEQIQGLNRANNDFARALSRAFNSQLRIAGLIVQAGDLASRALARRGSDFLSALEAQGQSVAVRLRALELQTNRELAQLQRTQQLALQQLSATGVDPFNTVAQIDSALSTVSRVLRDTARRSSDKIFNDITGAFDRDLLVLRERGRLERANFRARLRQTNEEIRVRRRLLDSEIQVLQQRINAERELRNLRIEQQRELGRILLRGPEEFNRSIRAIAQSRAFFQNIQTVSPATNQDVTRNQILEIARRATTLRDAGQFDILQGIQRGLQTAIRTGQPSPVGGLTNEELLRIFEQVIASGIPGGASAEDVAFQFERQREELARQTAEQRAVAQRQQAVQQLALRSAQIQEAEFRLAQIDVNVARQQRDQLLTSANLRLRELIVIRTALTQIVAQGTRLGRAETAPVRPRINPRDPDIGFLGGIRARGFFRPPREEPRPTPTPPTPPRREEERTPRRDRQTERFVRGLPREIRGAVSGALREVDAQRRRGARPLTRADIERVFNRDRAALREVRDTELREAADKIAAERTELARIVGGQAVRAFNLINQGQAPRDVIRQERFSELFNAIDERSRGNVAGIRAAIERILDPRTSINSLNLRTRTELEILRRFEREQGVLLQQRRNSLRELERASNGASGAQGNFGRQLNRLSTTARNIRTALQRLERDFRDAGANVEKAVSPFLELTPGLRPPGIARQQNIPGIRQNVPFNRVITEFLEGITVQRNRGITFEPRELRLLRQAVTAQGGTATPRQQRRIRELERQRESFGLSRFAAGRAARFVTEDPRRRRGVEVGFRELLQGDTPFIRELRDLTQTARGTRVGTRGRRELDVTSFRRLLQDAGLSNIAGGIRTNRDAANVANQLLRLSRGLERNQGRLGRDQLRLIERLLGQELQGNFDKVSESFNTALERGLKAISGRQEGETDRQFRQRRRQEEAAAAASAARSAVQNLPQGIFREAAEEVARRQEAAAQAQGNQFREAIDSFANQVKDLGINVAGQAQVQVQANVTNTLKADQSFTDALLRALPNIDTATFEAIRKTVGSLVQVEKQRGTPLPSDVGNIDSAVDDAGPLSGPNIPLS